MCNDCCCEKLKERRRLMDVFDRVRQALEDKGWEKCDSCSGDGAGYRYICFDCHGIGMIEGEKTNE